MPRNRLNFTKADGENIASRVGDTPTASSRTSIESSTKSKIFEAHGADIKTGGSRSPTSPRTRFFKPAWKWGSSHSLSRTNLFISAGCRRDNDFGESGRRRGEKVCLTCNTWTFCPGHTARVPTDRPWRDADSSITRRISWTVSSNTGIHPTGAPN